MAETDVWVVVEMKKGAFDGNQRVIRPLTFFVLYCIPSVYSDFWLPLVFKATHYLSDWDFWHPQRQVFVSRL